MLSIPPNRHFCSLLFRFRSQTTWWIFKKLLKPPKSLLRPLQDQAQEPQSPQQLLRFREVLEELLCFGIKYMSFCFTAILEKGQKSIRNLVSPWETLLQTPHVFRLIKPSRRPPKVQSRWCWRWRSSHGRTWPRLRMDNVTKYPTIVLG